MAMLSREDMIKVRDSLLEGDALYRIDKIQDEIEEIKFSDIFDKVKKDKEDPLSNVDEPTVSEPDFDLFNEGLEYDHYGNLNPDDFGNSNDVDMLINETDKAVNDLFEADSKIDEDADYSFDAFLENEIEIEGNNSYDLFENPSKNEESSDVLFESSFGSFDVNEDLLESEFNEISSLEESVILEEAEAMAQLDELSEQIIRDSENKNNSEDEYHRSRKQSLYEDDELDDIDDDEDGIADDYVDPTDVALVDKYLNDNEQPNTIQVDTVNPLDDDDNEEINPIDAEYAANPMADVDHDGIPDIEEPHGQLPDTYTPDEYDEYNDEDEYQGMEESDDLSFLFESDDDSSDNNSDDDSDDDNDNDSDDDKNPVDDDDDNDSDDDKNPVDDDDDDDITGDKCHKSNNDDDDSDDDDDDKNPVDDDDDDDEPSFSFDEDEEK